MSAFESSTTTIRTAALGRLHRNQPIYLDGIVSDLRPNSSFDDATRITKTMAEAAGITCRDPTMFLKKYNISKAEGRLLAALAERYSLIQHAEILCISVKTARTHMRRLLEKTGASVQLDLLRMFLTDK